MNHIKILLYVPLLMPFFNFAIQEPPMVHIQKAQDAAQFPNQIVAYAPVGFIDDRHAYKEPQSGALPSALRYAYVTPKTLPEWCYFFLSDDELEERQIETGHCLELLVTRDVIYTTHILFTRVLCQQRLLMRNVTPQETVRLLQIIRERKAHFEVDIGEKRNALYRLIAKL